MSTAERPETEPDRMMKMLELARRPSSEGQAMAVELACQVAMHIAQQNAEVERLRTALKRIWNQDGKGMDPQEFYTFVSDITAAALGYRKVEPGH